MFSNLMVTEAKVPTDVQDVVNTAKYGRWNHSYSERETNFLIKDHNKSAGRMEDAANMSTIATQMTFEDLKSHGYRLFVAQRKGDFGVTGYTAIDKNGEVKWAAVTPIVPDSELKSVGNQMKTAIEKVSTFKINAASAYINYLFNANA